MAVAALLFLGADPDRRRRRALSRRARRLLRLRPVEPVPEQSAAHLASAARRSSGSPPPMSPARCSWPACWAARAGRAALGHQCAVRRRRRSSPSAACSANGPACCSGCGAAWFWFGNQGWEYLEIGRVWQILLAIGLVFWFVLLWRDVRAGAARPGAPRLVRVLPHRRGGDPGVLPAGAVLRRSHTTSRSSTPGGSGSSICGSRASSSCS